MACNDLLFVNRKKIYCLLISEKNEIIEYFYSLHLERFASAFVCLFFVLEPFLSAPLGAPLKGAPGFAGGSCRWILGGSSF